MKKSNQIILSALGAIFIFSIAFQLHVNRHLRSAKPNEKALIVISEDRPVTPFDKISVSHGIEVYFSQDSISNIRIEAAEHLISYIKADVKNGELIIESIAKTKNSATVKVFITNDWLTALKAYSGSYFETIGVVKGDHLTLEFSSDTKANLELSYASVQCKAASGSQVKFKGNTSNIEFTN